VNVELAFGRSGLTVEAPDDAVVVRPASIAGAAHAEELVRDA
jgi:hypothetical protein